MKKIKKGLYVIIFTIFTIFTCVFMTGCSAGSKIYTNLLINEDLSGVRTMEVEIDSAVFKEYFTGTMEQLNNTIANNCPSDIVYRYEEVDGVMSYIFEITFGSPDDYQQKVRNITGAEYNVTVNTPDTVWASGFYINEDFSSSTLLSWLKEAIVNEGLVSASNAGNIFAEGDCSITYGEEVFTSGNMINVDTINYVSIDSIDLLTYVSDLNQYDRSLVFTIPSITMQQKGEEIRKFFEERMPNGAECEWVEDENGVYIYTVSKKGVNASDISAMNAKLFGTNDSVYTETEITESLSPFVFAVDVYENIDLSQYIVSGSEQVTIASYIAMVDGISYGESSKSVEEISAWYSESEKYPGYYMVNEKSMWGSEVYDDIYSIAKIYSVKELDITTKKMITGGFVRTFTFLFDRVPSEGEQEQILADLQKPFPQNENEGGEIESEEEISAEENDTSTEDTVVDTQKNEVVEHTYDIRFASDIKDDIFSINIEQKGSTRDIEEITALLTNEDCEVTYGDDFSFAKIKYDEAYVESIGLENILYSTTDDFVCNYEVDLGFGSEISKVNYGGALIDGGKFALTTTYVPENIYVISQKLNLWAVFFYVFLVAGIIFVAVAITKSDIIKNINRTAIQIKREKVEPEKVEEHAAFCENCGAPRDVDACVCVKCGTKF